MASERETEAKKYLKKHKILKLIENLTSLMFLHRPENPAEFLVEQLETLKRCRHSGDRVRGLSLFDANDLDTVFGVLDPADRRHVTFTQYKHALQTLGVQEMNECPDGVNDDRISRDTFRTEGIEALHRGSETFRRPGDLDRGLDLCNS